MNIAERLRAIREQRNLSQRDIERRTGLPRGYVSRIENGHSIPAVETLERWAQGLGVPLYQVIYDGDEPPKVSNHSKTHSGANLWGSSGSDARELGRLRGFLCRMKPRDRQLVLGAAHWMARERGH